MIAVFFASVALTLAQPPQQEQEPPNIVLILADDLGWSDVGCYGGEIFTPHLDSLASEGLRFTQFHNTAKCFPSRACLLTGLYAQQNGMARTPNAKIQNAATLAEVLRSAGYRTLMAGKHHGLDNPFERGFDHYWGLRDGAANYFNPGVQREGEGVPAQKRPAKRVWCFDGEVRQPFTPEDSKFYSTDAYTNWAIKFLQEPREKDQPFFLYLAYQAPHDPLQAWPEDIEKYRGKYSGGYEAIAKARYTRQLDMDLIDDSFPRSETTFREWNDLSELDQEDQERRMEVYAAMVDRMDQNIGRLLATIDEMGERDNTIVIFASDNGCSAEVVKKGTGPIGSMTRWASLGGDWANVSNTPFRKFKNYSHEGGVNTPLIVRWPAVIKKGGGVSRWAGHFIDFMPTFVELGKANYPDHLDGKAILPMEGESFAKVIRGVNQPRSKPLCWEWSKGRAVRSGDWKLVSWKGKWELYNLGVDATETQDLASVKLKKVVELETMFKDWKGRMPKSTLSSKAKR